MVAGAPIVTVSFGEERKFRLSRGTGEAKEVRDFPTPHGTVFVLPQETNAVWKHSVPKSARYTGRRISVTIRGVSLDRDNQTERPKFVDSLQRPVTTKSQIEARWGQNEPR
jgi:hypothetical protein